MILRRLGGTAALVLLIGCDATGPDEDVCQLGGEFASSGCGVVSGTVVDSAGSPLGGIIIGPRYPEGDGCCTTSYSTTGAEGRYSFRIYWVGADREDSLRIHVHAQRPGIGVLDSASAWVRFGGVGEIPPVTTVDLVLNRPY